ncbi:hypothetical protein SCG7086_CR_00010 [Chlamydiales bacterium SCGC AG-110-P3]|nr:hypothetical protein SCG7086_CR_00010 [Chlamydiales bacterium SCGC AG-110-P3]
MPSFKSVSHINFSDFSLGGEDSRLHLDDEQPRQSLLGRKKTGISTYEGGWKTIGDIFRFLGLAEEVKISDEKTVTISKNSAWKWLKQPGNQNLLSPVDKEVRAVAGQSFPETSNVGTRVTLPANPDLSSAASGSKVKLGKMPKPNADTAPLGDSRDASAGVITPETKQGPIANLEKTDLASSQKPKAGAVVDDELESTSSGDKTKERAVREELTASSSSDNPDSARFLGQTSKESTGVLGENQNTRGPIEPPTADGAVEDRGNLTTPLRTENQADLRVGVRPDAQHLDDFNFEIDLTQSSTAESERRLAQIPSRGVMKDIITKFNTLPENAQRQLLNSFQSIKSVTLIEGTELGDQIHTHFANPFYNADLSALPETGALQMVLGKHGLEIPGIQSNREVSALSTEVSMSPQSYFHLPLSPGSLSTPSMTDFIENLRTKIIQDRERINTGNNSNINITDLNNEAKLLKRLVSSYRKKYSAGDWRSELIKKLQYSSTSPWIN